MFGLLTAHPWETFIILCLIPFAGYKIAIPVGTFLLGTEYLFTLSVIAILSNIMLGITLYAILEYWVAAASKTPLLKRWFRQWETKVKNKARRYVQSYGIFSLVLLLLLPMPNTGVYSGSIFSHFLGYKLKDYTKGLCIGVVCSGVFVALFSAILYVLVQ